MKPTERFHVSFDVQAATVRSLRKQQLILTPGEPVLPPNLPGEAFIVEFPFALAQQTPSGINMSSIFLLPPEVFQSLNPVPVPDDESSSVADGTTQTVTAKEELDAQ